MRIFQNKKVVPSSEGRGKVKNLKKLCPALRSLQNNVSAVATFSGFLPIFKGRENLAVPSSESAGADKNGYTSYYEGY